MAFYKTFEHASKADEKRENIDHLQHESAAKQM
jgi:hypothetical protein